MRSRPYRPSAIDGLPAAAVGSDREASAHVEAHAGLPTTVPPPWDLRARQAKRHTLEILFFAGQNALNTRRLGTAAGVAA